MSADVLKIYRSLSRKPLGHWLFSRLICFKAPYFGSIGPRMVRLEPGRGEATIRHRRSVTNHLGTVHAIALCNLAEFVGGLTTDVSIPRSMRWIPKGMTVEYLKKAVGTMHAVATPAFEPHESAEGYDLPMGRKVGVAEAASGRRTRDGRGSDISRDRTLQGAGALGWCENECHAVATHVAPTVALLKAARSPPTPRSPARPARRRSAD